MELKDTVDLMLSDDYKDRFRAEYHQLRIRYNKLATIVRKYEDGTLGFEPDCSIEILRDQLNAMSGYLIILLTRAMAEGIDCQEGIDEDV